MHLHGTLLRANISAPRCKRVRMRRTFELLTAWCKGVEKSLLMREYVNFRGEKRNDANHLRSEGRRRAVVQEE